MNVGETQTFSVWQRVILRPRSLSPIMFIKSRQERKKERREEGREGGGRKEGRGTLSQERSVVQPRPPVQKHLQVKEGKNIFKRYEYDGKGKWRVKD